MQAHPAEVRPGPGSGQPTRELLLAAAAGKNTGLFIGGHIDPIYENWEGMTEGNEIIAGTDQLDRVHTGNGSCGTRQTGRQTALALR